MLAWVKAWHPAVRWGTALGLGLLALALLWTALASLIFLLGTRQLRVQGYQFAAFWQFLLEWGGHPRVAPWLRLAAIGATVGTPAVLAGAAWLAWPRIKRPLHGTSAHATGPEITAMGLHSTEPVCLYLGKLDGRYLRSSGPSHVAAYAPSRAGNGVGLVVPNLLTWAGSLLVLDVKGTLFRDTAGMVSPATPGRTSSAWSRCIAQHGVAGAGWCSTCTPSTSLARPDGAKPSLRATGTASTSTFPAVSGSASRRPGSSNASTASAHAGSWPRILHSTRTGS